jgi:outer membrane protein assembly factor BamB
MSGTGRIICFNTTDGKIVWTVDLINVFGARNLRWGMTESLLIDGDRLFCTPGGLNVMVAVLDRYTGKTLTQIRGNREKSAYCSPTIVTHGNKRLLLTMTGESLVALDADTEKYLWRTSHRTQYDINPNTPLYHDSYVYSVSGYGTGGQLFSLSPDATSAELIWAEGILDSQHGSAVLVDGYIYGSGHRNKGWHCIDWMTGQVQYTAKDLGGKGNIIYSDGMLYLYSEKGDFALVRPTPEKFDIVSSFKIDMGSGEHWAHPVIANGRLYIRHGDILMVYDISK